uniref:Uncharacterized protein n=1 Tax=Anopheles farauti TaxID=69004 RepID=A0A182Q6C5_9DIPT
MTMEHKIGMLHGRRRWRLLLQRGRLLLGGLLMLGWLLLLVMVVAGGLLLHGRVVANHWFHTGTGYVTHSATSEQSGGKARVRGAFIVIGCTVGCGTVVAGTNAGMVEVLMGRHYLNGRGAFLIHADWFHRRQDDVCQLLQHRTELCLLARHHQILLELQQCAVPFFQLLDANSQLVPSTLRHTQILQILLRNAKHLVLTTDTKPGRRQARRGGETVRATRFHQRTVQVEIKHVRTTGGTTVRQEIVLPFVSSSGGTRKKSLLTLLLNETNFLPPVVAPEPAGTEAPAAPGDTEDEVAAAAAAAAAARMAAALRVMVDQQIGQRLLHDLGRYELPAGIVHCHRY